MESNQREQDELINDIDKEIEEIEMQIAKMEKESNDFFEALRLSPHQIEDLLSEPKLYSKASFEYIQQQRYELEAALERRINKVNASLKRERSQENSDIKGHWIFVR